MNLKPSSVGEGVSFWVKNMHINTIKWIDRYIGPPVCLVLGSVRALQEFIRRDKRLDKDPEKILVLKLWGMGSILLASPALRAIKGRFSSARVTLLTLEENRDLVELLPSVDRVYGFNIGSIMTFPLNFLKMIMAVRRERYDLLIDLEFFANFTAIVAFCSGIPLSVGFTTPKFWRDRFYNVKVSFDHSRHASQIFLKVAQSVGANGGGLSFMPERFALQKGKDTGLEALFTGDCNRPVVCFNINASAMCYRRRWPAEYFSVVAGRLIRAGFTVVLIGSREDRGYVDDFLKLIEPSPYLINLCGKTNIRQLIALLERCTFFVGNDSGPLHIAAIMGIPTVSFFGPETPYLYGPHGNHNYVFYKDLYCSPCLNVYNAKTTYCNDNICLKEIRPEEVLSVIYQKFIRKGTDEKDYIRL